MAKATIQVLVYVGTKELKIAIEKYAGATKKAVWEVVAEAWIKMLESGDFSISINRHYERTNEPGLSRLDTQAQRRFRLTMPPELALKVDEIILNKNNKKDINRSSFTQEAIKRYLEPVLIKEGYLDVSQFRDYNKAQAVNNLITFRESLNLSCPKFMEKYLTVDDQLIISYPQYSAIERSGKGNVDKILEKISEVTQIDKDVFYLSSLDFNDFLINGIK